MLADGNGHCVHLGERDCSLQRRHQKVVEEAPSPVLEPRAARATRRALSPTRSRQLGYRGLGTVEFLYQDGEFYFIEMNTRLQVEHPVTELITGIDLVTRADQRRRRRAARASAQSDVRFTGHAIECRINAEDPRERCCRRRARCATYPPAGRARRADRFRALCRRHRAALLRQPDRQADRARHRPRGLPPPAASAASAST